MAIDTGGGNHAIACGIIIKLIVDSTIVGISRIIDIDILGVDQEQPLISPLCGGIHRTCQLNLPGTGNIHKTPVPSQRSTLGGNISMKRTAVVRAEQYGTTRSTLSPADIHLGIARDQTVAI